MDEIMAGPACALATETASALTRCHAPGTHRRARLRHPPVVHGSGHMGSGMSFDMPNVPSIARQGSGDGSAAAAPPSPMRRRSFCAPPGTTGGRGWTNSDSTGALFRSGISSRGAGPQRRRGVATTLLAVDGAGVLEVPIWGDESEDRVRRRSRWTTDDEEEFDAAAANAAGQAEEEEEADEDDDDDDRGVRGFVQWIEAAGGMTRAAASFGRLLDAAGDPSAALIAAAGGARSAPHLVPAGVAAAGRRGRGGGGGFHSRNFSDAESVAAAAEAASGGWWDGPDALNPPAQGHGDWRVSCHSATGGGREVATREALLEYLALFDDSLLRAREAAFYSESDERHIEETFVGCAPVTARMAFAFCLRAAALASCPGEGVPVGLSPDDLEASTSGGVVDTEREGDELQGEEDAGRRKAAGSSAAGHVRRWLQNITALIAGTITGKQIAGPACAGADGTAVATPSAGTDAVPHQDRQWRISPWRALVAAVAAVDGSRVLYGAKIAGAVVLAAVVSIQLTGVGSPSSKAGESQYHQALATVLGDRSVLFSRVPADSIYLRKTAFLQALGFGPRLRRLSWECATECTSEGASASRRIASSAPFSGLLCACTSGCPDPSK